MNSPEIFRLLEDLPKGAEAMIVRLLHIVTEKGKYLIFIILKSLLYRILKSIKKEYTQFV